MFPGKSGSGSSWNNDFASGWQLPERSKSPLSSISSGGIVGSVFHSRASSSSSSASSKHSTSKKKHGSSRKHSSSKKTHGSSNKHIRSVEKIVRKIHTATVLTTFPDRSTIPRTRSSSSSSSDSRKCSESSKTILRNLPTGTVLTTVPRTRTSSSSNSVWRERNRPNDTILRRLPTGTVLTTFPDQSCLPPTYTPPSVEIPGDSTWDFITQHINQTQKLCDRIEFKINANKLTDFDDIKRYAEKLLKQVLQFKSIKPPDRNDSPNLEKFMNVLRILKTIVRVAKGIANLINWLAPNPCVLQVAAVLAIVDAILTLVIGTYDIIYHNGNIWDTLLEMIIALLEFLPYIGSINIPDATKIKDLGQKGANLILAYRAVMKPMKENPTGADIVKKLYEIGAFCAALVLFLLEIKSTVS